MSDIYDVAYKMNDMPHLVQSMEVDAKDKQEASSIAKERIAKERIAKLFNGLQIEVVAVSLAVEIRGTVFK